MKHKNAPVTVAIDADEGVFEAIVSVFGNKDMVGDVVMPGAFTDSLNYWKSIGDPIPVYWSHRMDDPTYNIGEVIDARELTGGDPTIPDFANDWVKQQGGLYVKAKLDDFGLGSHVRHLMKTRRVKQFSFSYDVLAERMNKSGENELHKLWLHEVGPTPLGCNPMTELLSAKSAAPPGDQQPPESTPEGPLEVPPDAHPSPKRRPSALFLRHQADIALAQYELAD